MGTNRRQFLQGSATLAAASLLASGGTTSAADEKRTLIDGLGFRFYWATEGLRQADLDYSTTPESRASAETLDHM